MLMFADDVVIFSPTEEGLRVLFTLFATFCTNEGLTINQHKTKVMRFCKHSTAPTPDNFVVNDFNLEIVTSFRYLGVFLDTSASCSFAIS
jgi:hypothetical protein